MCNIRLMNIVLILTASLLLSFSAEAQITIGHTDATCGNANGTITITASFGTSPYQYSIDGTNFQAGNIFSNVAAGNYTVTVKDAGATAQSSNVVIVDVKPSFYTNSTSPACNNNNGSITFYATGGVAPYQYSISGYPYQLGNVFMGLPSGSYYTYVKDANNCEVNGYTSLVSNVFSLSAGPSPTACSQSSGSVTANVLGGFPPYLFSLNGIPYQSNNVFSGLAAGTYTVSAKDANGCILTVSVIIETATTVTTTIAYCGSGRSTINVNNCSGTPPYSYSLNGGTFQSSNIFSNLLPGSYIITIKDALGATEIISVTLNNTPLSLTAYGRFATCGLSNGSIYAYEYGGTAPYQYSIDGISYQSNYILTGLPAGIYSVYIKDANGCTAVTTATIINLELNVSCTTGNTSCNNNNGSITVNATGGLAPYQYSINGSSYQPGNVFTNLSPGTYNVYIKDANGCFSTEQVTIFAQTIHINATATNIDCNTNNTGRITVYVSGGLSPFQYSLNGISYQSSNVFTGLAAGSYNVYVKDANGCLSSAAVNIYNQIINIGVDTNSATCNNHNGSINIYSYGGTAPYQYSLNGTSYQSVNVFTGLGQGNYTAYVKDATGCTATQDFTLSSTGPSISAIANNASCGNNGSITAIAAGGSGSIRYSINGTAYQSGNIFNNLTAGTYTVFAKDGAGCISTTSATIITTGSSPTVTTTIKDATCSNNDGSITIIASGGYAPFLYSMNASTYQTDNTFTDLIAGAYTVYVKDANDCIGSSSIFIASTIIPPNEGVTIYPNPTTNNQFTLVLGNQLQGSYKVRILDAIGQLVYHTTIQNSCICCTGSYAIKLPKLLSSGVYNVQIIKPDGKNKVVRLMLSEGR
jgi:hypothetical protein